jgi:predicted phosphodiesterase
MIRLAESDVRHFLMGIKPNQFLVYGHTHYPTDYFNPGDSIPKTVANTGCWGIGEDEEFWYLEIEGDEVYNRVYKSG